jgi:murein endopeptidase
MTIRVPGLVLFPGGTKHIKVGGTCEHHGPGGGGSCETPDNNHWGTNRLGQAIQAIANAYDSLHRRVRLRINDMSLPHGGLFDVNGNWLTDHREHREGINADIGYNGLDSLNQAVQMIQPISKISY